jgi:hypothetical protein
MGANAQTSVPLFVANSVLTAAQQNISAATGVPVFATTVTRDAAFGGSNKVLAEGQLCYLESTDVVQQYNGASWVTVGPASAAGLVPVVPTSVAVSSGTATANANGQVTFTTVGSVSLNGVFNSTYKNYVVIWSEDTSSVTAVVKFFMRLAGTDNTTASSYITQWIRATSTTVSAAKDTLAYGQIDVSGGTQSFATLSVFSPAIATPTYFTCFVNTQTSTFVEINAATHTQSVAYDGITFQATSGTMTGTVSIYGYTN